MQRPPVSVIIPVRNGGRFLGDALRSVRGQTGWPLEVLVVDGHSDDDTEQVARAFPGVTFVPQHGHGLPAAYNQGIETARSNWLAFLEADDIWTADKLDVQMRAMLDRPERLFTMAHARFFVETGCVPPAGFRARWLEADQAGALLSTFVARREAFARVGLFDTSLKIAADVDWLARAKDLCVPGATLPETLLNKRVHDGNLTNLVDENNAELLRVIRGSLSRRWNQNRATP